ncbi:MAG TPA: dephospho-CoA kinase [Thermoanaerobaculia bacterium]|nr:dephospho-CoA kinase [Thermoanaerobaculia bacterium]
MILRVGLTGGISSGKSTIARTLADLGCLTIDADQIVAALYRPGALGHEALVRKYGAAILLPDGEIDRRKLAGIAFATAGSAAELNALIHPLVIEEEARLIGEEEARQPDRDRIAVVEATLLLEAGGRSRYDRIVVVDLVPQKQIERAVARGMDRDDLLRRIANQLPREERLRAADYIIDNNPGQRIAEIETRRLYEKLLVDLGKKKAGEL